MPDQKSILVVDAETGSREATLSMLRDEKRVAIGVANGLSALNLAQRLSFDLLLVDVFLPDITGRTLADRVAAIQPRLKVLFTSTYSRSVLNHDLCPLGSALLSKPFRKETLLPKVGMVLAFHRPWKSLAVPRPQVEEELHVPLDGDPA